MPYINGEPMRELFLVTFATRQFRPSSKGVIDTAGEDVQATARYWALDGEEAVALCKRDLEKDTRMPWLGLVGLQPVGLAEVQIANQPKLPAPLQPFKMVQVPDEGLPALEFSADRIEELESDSALPSVEEPPPPPPVD